jgi:CHAT domain-containing protein
MRLFKRIVFIFLVCFTGLVYAQKSDESQKKIIELSEFVEIIKSGSKERVESLANLIIFNKLDIATKAHEEKAAAFEILADELERKFDNKVDSFLVLNQQIFAREDLSVKYRWEVLARQVFLASKIDSDLIDEIAGNNVSLELARETSVQNQSQSLVAYAIAERLLKKNPLLAKKIIIWNLDVLNKNISINKFNKKELDRLDQSLYTAHKLYADYQDPQAGETFNYAVGRRIVTREIIKKIVDSKFYSMNEKAEIVLGILNLIGGSQIEYEKYELIAIAEELVFYQTGKADITESQLTVIMSTMNSVERWPFKRSMDDVLNHVHYISNKNKASPAAAALAMKMFERYTYSGEFVKADKQLEFLRNYKFNPKTKDQRLNDRYANAYPVIIEKLHLKSLLFRGDLQGVNVQYPKVMAKYKVFLNFISDYPSYKSSLGGFSDLGDVALYMGDIDGSIFVCKSILENSGDDDSFDHSLNLSRAKAYDCLANAYEKKSNQESAYDARKKAFNLRLRSGAVSAHEFGFFFIQAMLDKQYEFADKLLDRFKSALDKNNNKQSSLGNFSPIEIMESWLDSCKKDPENSNLHFKNFSKNLAPELEILANESLRNNLDGSAASGLFEAYTFYIHAEDKEYAAFLGKRYVNLIQQFRSNLAIDQNVLNQFTESQYENLKKIASNFYDVGDSESALLTLRILKENLFLDFLRRASLNDIGSSKLALSNDEKDLLDRMNTIFDEVMILQKSLVNKGGRSIEEIKLIEKSLLNKKIALEDVRNILRNKIRLSGSRSKPEYEKNKKINLVDGEAYIEYVVREDLIDLYIQNSSGVVKKYSTSFSRARFREDMLEIQSNILKKSSIKRELIEKVSAYLMIDKVTALSSGGIKTIKISLADYLAIIPYSILGKDDSVGDLFGIQIAGLSDKKIARKPVNSVAIFGSTKQHKNFSALPFVREEIDFINKLNFSSEKINKNSLYADESFNKKTLFDEINSGASYVHIATHYQPLSSSQGGGRLLLGDGSVLTLNEISSGLKKNFDTRLVTLSACETGTVQPSSGMQGFEGLTTLFVANGAEYVVGTLWEVSDQATSDFIKVFYLFLDKSNPVSALSMTKNVFQNADLSPLANIVGADKGLLIKSLSSRIKSYSSPYYWAGFQVVGQ